MSHDPAAHVADCGECGRMLEASGGHMADAVQSHYTEVQKVKRQQVLDALEAMGTHELAVLSGGVRLSRGRPSNDLRQTLIDLVLEEMKAGRVKVRASGSFERR